MANVKISQLPVASPLAGDVLFEVVQGSINKKATLNAIQDGLTGKSSVGHLHAIADVAGLQTALGGKAATSHSHNDATTSASGFMSAADKTKLDGVAAGANAYVHPNHSGDVTSVGDGATTIAANVVTNAKLAQVTTATIKGRATVGTGNPEDLTASQVRTIINVADGATANATDAQLRDRATHTGTQIASTISDFSEAVDDRVAALLVAGSNISLSYNDAGNALTVALVGSPSVSGTVSDSKGDVRDLPLNSRTSAYTAAIGDTGRVISITTGGVNVPSWVFSAGQAFTVFNDSASNQTITQGVSVTLRQAGTTNTGNRTLAAYGTATVLCVAPNVFVISGAGLS